MKSQSTPPRVQWNVLAEDFDIFDVSEQVMRETAQPVTFANFANELKNQAAYVSRSAERTQVAQKEKIDS